MNFSPIGALIFLNSESNITIFLFLRFFLFYFSVVSFLYFLYSFHFLCCTFKTLSTLQFFEFVKKYHHTKFWHSFRTFSILWRFIADNIHIRNSPFFARIFSIFGTFSTQYSSLLLKMQHSPLNILCRLWGHDIQHSIFSNVFVEKTAIWHSIFSILLILPTHLPTPDYHQE